MGPMTSCIVSVIVASIEMITVSDTGILGCIMNIIQTLSFACTAAVIYKKRHTLSGAVLGLGAGCLAMIVVMLMWNYLVTPLYMGYPREAVAELLIPVFLPFNLLKELNASVTFLLYKACYYCFKKKRICCCFRKRDKKQTCGHGFAGVYYYCNLYSFHFINEWSAITIF